MLDTKLKNRHKLAVVLIVVTVIAATLITMSGYPRWYREEENMAQQAGRSAETSQAFLEQFIEASYFLYNTERKGADSERMKEWLEVYVPDEKYEFDGFYPYLDYQVKDEDGKIIAKSAVESGGVLSENHMDNYAIGMVVAYDENGTPSVTIKKSDYREEQTTVLREILNHFEENHAEWNSESYEEYYGDGEVTTEDFSLETPKNRTYLFAMTEENVQTYLSEWCYIGVGAPNLMNYTIMVIMAVTAVLAMLYPSFSSLHTGNEKIFQTPFEVVAIVFCSVVAVVFDQCGWMLQRKEGYADLLDFVIWALVFAVVYWAAVCVRQIYSLGIRRYVKERTLILHCWKYMKKAWKFFVEKVKKWIRKIYDSLMHIDFSQKSNQAILKIVLCNFIILAAICVLWVFGIMALIVYSVILFFILRKFYNDLQEKYAVLLKVTGELAKGNLDVEITEDLGVFAPFKTEIEKIQSGFKKAVEEEVKSQRMKTELITNVSHDLKTPLTAIITYVNLLKEEKDPERQKEYIDVLDRKSMRLKVLIEDLFEVSKASSRNVTLNLTDIDIVNLFKQVKLEMEDKILAADLEFKCNYSPEKIMVRLDSQKTYRIFENLLGNIAKYALPHTRVYVDICREGEEAVVRMKNISAEELNFDPEEITERFVRGDVARNTEGSGLGLAIVKSFVELQKGTFKIETEADLFKAEIRWK